MLRISDSDLPRRGFRTYSREAMPMASQKQKLRSMLTAQSYEFLLSDLHAHSATAWKVKQIKEVSDTHPDKNIGGHTYTHTVRIVYRNSVYPQHLWEIIYGITETKCVHLWMD